MMEDVKSYRRKLLEILLSAKDANGNPRLTEKSAKDLSKELTDQELLDGMDFNTLDEVAEMLLDSGL